MGTIIILLVVITIGVLVISGKARTLVKGFVGLFIEDVAKTPEGASAVYTEAIDNARDQYTRASNALQNAAGKLETAKQNKVQAEIKIQALEQKAERLAGLGDKDNLVIVAQQRQLELDNKKAFEDLISKLSPLYEDAKKATVFYENKVKQLEAEKNTIINKMKIDKQVKEMYDDMDDVKCDDNIDKLLAAVKEGATSARENSTGARVVHESRTTTKLGNIDAQMKSAENDEYIKSLLSKHGKA